MASTDMQSNEDDLIPDRATCQKLTENFAEITGTDEACAQFFLQDRQWDLERSLNAYYESLKGGINILNDGDESEVVVTFDSAMKSMLESATTKPPDKFRLLTWNIDGLDDKNLKKRTKAVLRTIESYKPDIVFLQELVCETYKYLENKLTQYMAIPAAAGSYFTAAFLLRTTVYYDAHQIIDYDNTLMFRNMLYIEAHIGKTKLRLINTHLESTRDFAKERTEQFKQCMKLITKGGDKNTINILAGDLNIRDNEVASAHLSDQVQDAWIHCGRRKECQFTWDLKRNTNKQMPSRFQPSLRLDRVFFYPSKPPKVAPVFFGFVGLEKVTNTESFPSDHWGVLVDFKIPDQSNSKSESSNGSSSSCSSPDQPTLSSFISSLENKNSASGGSSNRASSSGMTRPIIQDVADEGNEESIIQLD